MKIVIKPKSVMKDYVALHSLVPKGEIRDFRHHIPAGQIWIRKDIYENISRYPEIKFHETYEVNLMKQGLTYRKAHRMATKLEKFR